MRVHKSDKAIEQAGTWNQARRSWALLGQRQLIGNFNKSSKYGNFNKSSKEHLTEI
jgi:hypothetical protein